MSDVRFPIKRGGKVDLAGYPVQKFNRDLGEISVKILYGTSLQMARGAELLSQDYITYNFN